MGDAIAQRYLYEVIDERMVLSVTDGDVVTSEVLICSDESEEEAVRSFEEAMGEARDGNPDGPTMARIVRRRPGRGVGEVVHGRVTMSRIELDADGDVVGRERDVVRAFDTLDDGFCPVPLEEAFRNAERIWWDYVDFKREDWLRVEDCLADLVGEERFEEWERRSR